MKNFVKGNMAKETGRISCATAFILGYTKSLSDFGQIAQGPYGLLLSASLSCCNA